MLRIMSWGVSCGIGLATLAGAQTMEFVATFNGPEVGHENCHAMAVDGAGNLYVCGVAEFAASGSDFATVKYDPSGNLLWARYWDAAGNGDDRAYSLMLDSTGDVLVGEMSGALRATRTWP